MDFGSEYVYQYPNSDEEVVSDEEFESGIDNASKPEKHHWSFHRSKESSSAGTTTKGAGEKHISGTKWRRADTNVVVVSFEKLTSPSVMHTGDPVFCKSCSAMMSHISKVMDEGNQKVWGCEFCGSGNEVDTLAEEVTSKSDVTYMLQPASLNVDPEPSESQKSLVIFCLDISGSMSCSVQVPSTFCARKNSAHQNRPGPHTGPNNMMYITRLEGIQAGIDFQLGELLRKDPECRVALVTFGNTVEVIGDGMTPSMKIGYDTIHSKEKLIKIGSELVLPASVKDTRTVLGKAVYNAKEGGQTALGPAMVIAISMACRVPGSKVIMCTDGCANAGVGSLEGYANSDVTCEAASTFYTEVAEMARTKGVSVSVLTIDGTDCRLVELGRVAHLTEGQVDSVDPAKISDEFGNILAEPTIATSVEATFVVHNGLYIRDDLESDKKTISTVVRKVGNVSLGSEITFEFGVRCQNPAQPSTCSNGAKSTAPSQENSKEINADSSNGTTHAMHDDTCKQDEATSSNDDGSAAAAAADADEEGATACAKVNAKEESMVELPFQVQIRYTDLDGNKALRVLTETRRVTNQREVAEKHMNKSVIGLHAVKKSSQLAQGMHYTQSRMNAYMNQRMMYRNCKTKEDETVYKEYCAAQTPLDQIVIETQRRESSNTGHSMSTYERASPLYKKGDYRNVRQQNCSDSLATAMYSRKSSKPFSSSSCGPQDKGRSHTST